MSLNPLSKKEDGNRTETRADTGKGKSSPSVPALKDAGQVPLGNSSQAVSVLKQNSNNITQRAANPNTKTPLRNMDVTQPKEQGEESPVQLQAYTTTAQLQKSHVSESKTQMQPFQLRPALNEGIAVNDDKHLEQEAYVMGDKALKQEVSEPLQIQTNHQDQNVIQQVTDNGGNGTSEHLVIGKLYQSETSHSEGDFAEKTPVVIEVNEMSVASAKAKIDGYDGGNIKNKIPVAFVIGINQKASAKNTQAAEVDAMALEIAEYLESKDLDGGCFSFVWKPTGEGGGYTFPFLEARSLLTLHPGVGKIHTRMNELAGSDPVVRGMDGDVSSDPLLSGTPLSPYAEEALVSGVNSLSEGSVQVVSGGYIWNPDDVKSRLQALTLFTDDTTVGDIKTMITLLNKYELQVRQELTETYSARSVYWPEPNTYMTLGARKAGATAMKKDPTVFANKSQQKESTHYVKAASIEIGNFNPDLAIVKPMKTYLDILLAALSTSFTSQTNPKAGDLKDAIITVRQTHLNPAAIDDNYNWTDKKMKYEDLGPAKGIVLKYLDKCSGDIVSMMTELIAERKKGN